VTAEQDVATLSLRTRHREESCDSRIGLYLISLGELYLHEPDELRLRVEELLRRNKPRIVTYNPFHAHRYACGTFLTCEARPAKDVRRTDAAIVMAGRLDRLEDHNLNIESGRDSWPAESSRSSIAFGEGSTQPSGRPNEAARMPLSLRRAAIQERITSEHPRES
jgi:hypothetical protein